MNWIESKALFANENLHKRYSEDQLQSYYNRYIKHILYVCTIISVLFTPYNIKTSICIHKMPYNNHLIILQDLHRCL